MMSYNPIEKKLARLLSSFPGIKSKIKFSYQWFNYILNKPKTSFETKFSLHEWGEEHLESFFGYYDKSPLNATNEYAIFQQTKHATHEKPSAEKPVEVVLYHVPSKTVVHKWETTAYNWQQGAKPMWLDEQHFSFNFYNPEKKAYGAKIIDIKEPHNPKVSSTPLYDANNKTGLSLSFERLNQIMPDYGYRHLNSPGHFDLAQEGIIKVDLENGQSELLISVAQIIDVHPQKSMEDATHWFNHIQLSPDGKHFIFLHRWIQNGKKSDALIVSDIKGQNIQCLADDGMVSHCVWKNDGEIVSYMRDEELGDHYYLIDIERGKRKKIGNKKWEEFGDGHPHIFKNQMVFDTYPNRSRIKELYLYDFDSEKLLKPGAFLEPLKYFGETRCDLHPRFSMDGKKVFFDSVHSGRRRLYYIDLEEVQ
jgi:hypothetical protein